MTDDEEELELMKPYDQEVWLMKRDIRISFKTHQKPPDKNLDFYKLGRIIGKGTITKINLVL